MDWLILLAKSAGYYIQGFNLAFLGWKVSFRDNALTHLEDMPDWQVALIFVVMTAWFLGAIGIVRYHVLVPHLSEEELKSPDVIRKAVDFIAASLGITAPRDHALPLVNFVDSAEDLYLLNSDWTYQYDGLAAAYVGGLVNRLYLLTPRVDYWAHELTHYVQHVYMKVGDFRDDRYEEEAWRTARKLLRQKYFFRYWVLMILYYHCGLWRTSTPITRLILS